MAEPISDDPLPNSEIILYQTEDGRTRIQCRFENETIWLTQALISELFQVTVSTVNEHMKGIYAEGELAAATTIRKFRIVRTEGKREVAREIEDYNLGAILAVGFRSSRRFMVRKNKRPRQSPKPNVDRESPVLGRNLTQLWVWLPFTGCITGGQNQLTV